jgi:tRNA threonylcarbamoyladenosine biosynthesis protein TsaB
LRILGIDTSSKFLSIALGENNDIIIEENCLLDRQHSSLLVPKIDELLKKSGISIKAIDAFIVGLGPGSFTGLRIGVSTVKGFGIACDRPCIGVPSIDALAFNAPADAEFIIPVIDAKRGQVYSAIYKKERGRIIKKSGYFLMPISGIMKRVRYPAVFLGDALELYGREIKNFSKGPVFLKEEDGYPRAGYLIKLGVKNIKKSGKNGLSKLKPLYLYPKDCQVKK